MGLIRANKSVVALIVGITVMSVLPNVRAGDLNSESGNEWSADLITSVPRTMSYQGILKDSGGNPVTDSVYSVTFRIFNSETGGSSLWDQTSPCTTSAGYFNAMIENVNLPFDEAYWLELEIDSEILDPRQKMSMVGYAAVADTADYAFNAPAGGGTGWVDDGAVVRLETSTDRVGIGTSSPLTKFHVVADSNYGIAGTAAPTGNEDYAGVVGYVDGGTGTNTGVSGNANNGSINRGVSGQAEGPGAENIGVYGYAQGGDVNWAGYFDGDAAVEQILDVQGKAIIGPGHSNTGLSAFTVGENNRATGYASFAAGRRAKADHNGTFVWGDDTELDFVSTANNQFLIRASGGVGIGTNSPAAALDVNGDVNIANNVTIIGKAAIGPGNTNAGTNAFAVGENNSAGGLASFAAGKRAKANHNGTFVWGDDTDADFQSTADDQYLIRASGGVGIGTNSPTAALHVNGEAKCEVGGVEFFMVPRGAIIMWSGLLANIPSGWVLCDGTNGTPDLRNRFIYCVQSGEDPGALGGSDSIPAHNHNIDIAEFLSLQSEESITVQEGIGFTFPLHGANHYIDPPSTLSSNNGSASNLPPYYKLAFIMKL